VLPGNELIQRILQRGVDRGEFQLIDMKYGVYTVTAQLMFLAMWKHSLGTCVGAAHIDPETYIAVQAETLLAGLSVRPPPLPSVGPATL
jgi:TetR/AcrR family transcriptional regulator